MSRKPDNTRTNAQDTINHTGRYCLVYTFRVLFPSGKAVQTTRSAATMWFEAPVRTRPLAELHGPLACRNGQNMTAMNEDGVLSGRNGYLQYSAGERFPAGGKVRPPAPHGHSRWTIDHSRVRFRPVIAIPTFHSVGAGGACRQWWVFITSLFFNKWFLFHVAPRLREGLR